MKNKSLITRIPFQRPRRGLLIPEIELDFRPLRLKKSWCHGNPRKGDDAIGEKEIERESEKRGIIGTPVGKPEREGSGGRNLKIVESERNGKRRQMMKKKKIRWQEEWTVGCFSDRPDPFSRVLGLSDSQLGYSDLWQKYLCY